MMHSAAKITHFCKAKHNTAYLKRHYLANDDTADIKLHIPAY
jgi:hypothetical protein